MDGIVIVDKPKDFTSHDVVNIARKALKTKRIGHIGTLDPNATGVLVLCVDRATKLVKYFENHTKTYLATIQLGVQTDTDDMTGRVINEKNIEIEEDKVKETLLGFLGRQKQIPPNYSAIKVGGKKLYELARRDLAIPDLEPRDIEIHSIDDFEVLSVESFIFKVSLKVSKGTYIRSIARDLGEMLGTFGSLKELERLEIDRFKLKDAVDLETLKSGDFELKDPFDYLDLPHYEIDSKLETYVKHGRFLEANDIPIHCDVVLYDKTKKPLAIYFYDKEKNQMRMSVKWCLE